MTYETLCHRLSTCYEAGEAKALVRWVLDVRFGLSAGYSTCVSACRWQTFFAAKLHNYPQTTKQNWKKSCRDLKKANPYNI